MRKIDREEIEDYQTYSDGRELTRPIALAAKAERRIQVGEYFTFLFENRETVRYQIQEMLRIERIVRDTEIQHEITTYNELLYDGGRLGCTFLIGIDDPEERDVKLRAWLGLTERIYATLPDGTRVRPTFDARQVGDDRLSAVQYLMFPLGGTAPVALGIDLEGTETDAALTEVQRQALQADLDEA